MPAVMKMAAAVRSALRESSADLGIRTLALTLATKLDAGLRSELAYASVAKELRQVLIYIASVDKGSEDDLNAFLRGLSSEVGDSPIA
jgi:hypothetical protein